jgi:hypothetical protein
MKSLTLLRFSAATFGITALVAAAAHMANISLSIPTYQLRLAWTLTRVLIQL